MKIRRSSQIQFFVYFCIATWLSSSVCYSQMVEVGSNLNMKTLSDSKYVTGRELCFNRSSVLKKEFPYWIRVPKSYKEPKRGTTEVYAYTFKPIVKTNPTVLFFTGGPGISGRSIPMHLKNTNVIYFDPRGVACSRPELETDFLDPNFYSSTTTALDAFEILKHLKLNAVSIYGHSYGTVAATIFASYFPLKTKNLILEGVVYSADSSLVRSELKKTILQKFFDSLDHRIQDKIISLGNSLLAKTWFANVGSMMLYLNEGVASYAKFLDIVLSLSDEQIFQAIGNFDLKNTDEDLLYSSRTNFAMISCQETTASNFDQSSSLAFSLNRKLEYIKENSFFDFYCFPLGFNQKQNKSIYHANSYPVEVPVYYLLGQNDGATDLNQGLKHYKNVAKGIKKLLIMLDGGHMPNLGFIKDNWGCDSDKKTDRCKSRSLHIMQTEIFNHIIHYDELDFDLINKFNKISSTKWVIQ